MHLVIAAQDAVKAVSVVVGVGEVIGVVGVVGIVGMVDDDVCTNSVVQNAHEDSESTWRSFGIEIAHIRHHSGPSFFV